jgi:hypothetical protein
MFGRLEYQLSVEILESYAYQWVPYRNINSSAKSYQSAAMSVTVTGGRMPIGADTYVLELCCDCHFENDRDWASLISIDL